MIKLSKQECKQISQYKIKKYRQQDNLFLAEGNKVVAELSDSPIRIQRIIVSENWLSKYNISEFSNHEVFLASTTNFKKMSTQKHGEGILAVCEIPNYSLPTEIVNWSVAIDGLNDPGNLGSIIRLSDWFGIEHLFCSMNTVEAYNPKVVRSTMGSITRVKIHYVDLASFLAPHIEKTYGAFLNGDSIYSLQPTNSGILVIGSESHGISQKIQEMLKHQITIPKYGGAESLNASVATGILLSHLLQS